MIRTAAVLIRIFRLAVPALLSAAAAVAEAAPVLVVDTVAGDVSADLLGDKRSLKPGDVIREREVLQTAGADSRLSLLFASEGLLELGADASLAIEKLPLSDDASDLRSLVSLRSGYLRVLWTPAPERATRWPFHLFVGGQRSTLVPGEYFFERSAAGLRSCVASGRLTIAAIAGDGIEKLRPGACYDLQVAEAAKRQPRSEANFEAVRREFTTTPTGKLPPPPAPSAVLAESPAASSTVAAAAPTAPTAPARPAVAKPAAGPSAASASSAAPPAPAPVRVATAPTGQPAGWTLLLGSYGNADNAAQVVDKLRAGGYQPFTRIKEVDGKTWHSVQVRGYPSREVADAKAADVVERLRIKPVKVVLLP